MAIGDLLFFAFSELSIPKEWPERESWNCATRSDLSLTVPALSRRESLEAGATCGEIDGNLTDAS